MITPPERAPASVAGTLVLAAVRDRAGRVRDLRYLRIGSRAAEIMALDPLDLVDRRMLELEPDLDLDVFRPMAGAVEDGVPYEWRTSRPRGSFAGTLRLHAAAVGDVLVVSVDDDAQAERTEAVLRRQRDALRESQRTYAALAENSPDIIARFDPRLRHVYVNAAVAEATGIPAERWLGRTHREMGVPAHLEEEWRSHLRAAFDGGGERAAEFEYPTPDGLRFYHARLVPEHGPDGRVTHVLSVARDVTEMRRAADALRAREAEEAAMRRAATEVARERDPRRIFEVVSREAAMLLGADAAYVIRLGAERGSRIVGCWSRPGAALEIDHGHDLSVGDAAAARTIRAGRPTRVDDYGAHADPASRRLAALGHASAVGAPILNDGAPWGAVVVLSATPHGLAGDAERRLGALATLAELAVVNAEARAALVEQALTDYLTGLANRRAFTDGLGGEVARAERHGQPLSLVVLDLDRFKRVNDTHGHAAGDRVLVAVARRLVAASRRGEQVARIGGEEFAWVLPGSDLEGAHRAAERARRRIAREEVSGVGTVTVSAGVAARRPGEEAAELLRAADRALYEAKSAGRDRTVVAAVR